MDVAMLLLLEEEEEEEEIVLNRFLRNGTHPIFKCREEQGCFKTLILKHLMDDETKFREYFRLSTDLFHTILSSIKDDITSKPCNKVREPISAMQKFCLTLRFLATGESYRSLAFQFRISHCWIGTIIKKTLQAIIRHMMHVAMPYPDKAMMIATAQGFWEKWNFPNCSGAVDGKHVRIKCPANTGSNFFNYKDYFSVVLFALVDHNYKFLVVDVGCYGKEGDSGILPKSTFGKAVSQGTFPFPDPTPLPGTDIMMNHVLLGDDAFKLTPCFMRPYQRQQAKEDETKALYNYRHSRARRCSENAFGILCQYFRVFFTPISNPPETVDDLILSACILHNLLRTANILCPSEEEENLPQSTANLISLSQPTTGRKATHLAYSVRDKFKDFFCSENGSVDWQLNAIRKSV